MTQNNYGFDIEKESTNTLHENKGVKLQTKCDSVDYFLPQLIECFQ